MSEAIVMRADQSVRHRIRIELMIARKTIRTLRDAGFDIYADNGEDRTSVNASERELIDCLFACDESHLFTHKDGKRSFVFFVLGNDGFDVISDYGSTLDQYLQTVNDYATQLEVEG